MTGPSATPRALSATLIGFGAVVLWSALALLTALSGDVPPFELAALTFAVGGLCGLVYAAARGRLAALVQPWPVWAVGIGGLFGYHALYFAALRRAPPADASLIAYLWPLLIVLFSAALPGERLRARHLIGAALGFGGAATLFLSKGASFAASGGRALDRLCARPLLRLRLVRLFRALAQAQTAPDRGGRRLLPRHRRARDDLPRWRSRSTVVPATAGQWLAILGLGLGPVGLAFYVWDHGVKHGDIRLLGVAAYAAPVLSTLILVAAGVAPATTALAFACALIVGGALIASRGG